MIPLWPYPVLRDLIFLDYPLDILLNRECVLEEHEWGLWHLLDAYQRRVDEGTLPDDKEREKLAMLIDKDVRARSSDGPLSDKPRDRDARWSARVLDWRAAAECKWNEAFPKEHRDDLDRQIRDLAGFRPSPQGMDVLRLHFLLRERTIGAFHLWPRDDRGKDGTSAGRTRDPVSGSVVIAGEAGSGKSTLALQIALAFAHWPNQHHVLYLALEESAEELRAKAGDLSPGWYAGMRPVVFLDNIEDESSPSAFGRQLHDFLTQPDGCPVADGVESSETRCKPHDSNAVIQPSVLLPRLSPRNVIPQTEGDHPLFWERLRQLERLLVGANWLQKKYPDHPQIRLACIDSLNAFGDRPLTRDELRHVLGLFRRFHIVGLCTLEAGAGRDEMASSDLVDVLIRLGTEKDNGYSIRYLEIAKSRYEHQVYGRHPFRLRREKEMGEERGVFRPRMTEPPPAPLFQAVKVFPSIHYIVGSHGALECEGLRSALLHLGPTCVLRSGDSGSQSRAQPQTQTKQCCRARGPTEHVQVAHLTQFPAVRAPA